MFTIGFVVATLLVAPTAFALGVFAARDRRTTHERADIEPALRRSSR